MAPCILLWFVSTSLFSQLSFSLLAISMLLVHLEFLNHFNIPVFEPLQEANYILYFALWLRKLRYLYTRAICCFSIIVFIFTRMAHSDLTQLMIYVSFPGLIKWKHSPIILRIALLSSSYKFVNTFYALSVR